MESQEKSKFGETKIKHKIPTTSNGERLLDVGCEIVIKKGRHRRILLPIINSSVAFYFLFIPVFVTLIFFKEIIQMFT